MEIITERHKNCLRDLLKLVREKMIPEEFIVFYNLNGAFIYNNSRGFVEIETLSPLGLEALTKMGYIFSKPNYERSMSTYSHGISRTSTNTTEREREASRICFITPEGIRAVDNNFAPIEDTVLQRYPIEITSSLAKFREDFPDPSRIVFVMMQFGKTTAHENILSGIRKALDPHGFITLRADDKQYHDSLYFNILTYIWMSVWRLSF